MKLVNLCYGGIRNFLNGLIEQGDKLGDWSYCNALICTRLNAKLSIGGVELDVVDGRTLLDSVVSAAKQNKLTKEEAEEIASYLDRISLRFNSIRTPFFVSAIEQEIVEKELTDELVSDIVAPVDTIVADEATDVEQPVKRGRKAK